MPYRWYGTQKFKKKHPETMKSKKLIFLLLITSLIGYLEWGGNNQMFLFQAEAEIISKLFADPKSVMHPFILFPMAGQLLLLIALFQKNPNILLVAVGSGGLGILLGFMFVVGIISLNFKIIFSTIPYIVVALYAIRRRKIKPDNGN